MPRVRLTGLFLFITSIVLGLASAATRTTHLRFKKPDQPLVAGESSRPSAPQLPNHPEAFPQTGTLPNSTQASVDSDQELDTLQFVSIPMIYPLFSVATAGLLLWFVPAAIFPPKATNDDRKGRARRRRKSTRGRKP